jgi:hypothetical protein
MGSIPLCSMKVTKTTAVATRLFFFFARPLVTLTRAVVTIL